MKRSFLKTALTAALVTALCCGVAWARGEEGFGNEPLSEANYNEWPGIMPVVNHPSRVYRMWVDGAEDFYYQGDTAALNDTLRKLAEAELEGCEVVLRPGPGLARSFSGEKTTPFGWSLHLIGGIARHLTSLDGGEKVWRKHPVLAIYVGGEVDLAKLRIPPSLTVTSVSQVKQRTREGLKSRDKTVRGWGAGVLAALDPYDPDSRKSIAALLKDPDNWVRVNAVLSIVRFGKDAQSTLPMLRAALETDDAQLKSEAEKSIRAIEQAEDRAAGARAHREMLERIDHFVAERKR
ncbi:MAG TPA: HEAT repeat domain-containing protein [Armatimonadota bacterium]|nr:HEAT repeat domain-containing protein [Armatimonadota bacterium]